MIKLKPIHEQLAQLNGENQLSGLISVQWLLDAITKEMKTIQRQYARTVIDTNLKKISIRFLFDHTNVRIYPVKGSSKFALRGFDFELELLERNGQSYGDKYCSLFVSYNNDVKGEFKVISIADYMSDLSYAFEPIDLQDVSIQQRDTDDQVINRNFASEEDFNSSVRAIMLFLDYQEYVEDLFSSLPTPNVFEALGAYKIAPPFNVSVQEFPINNRLQEFLVVKGASKVDRTVICDCGEPGGVTTVDEITPHDGEYPSGSRVRRTRTTTNTPVTDTLMGEFVAGFLLPFYDKSNGTYKTFLKDLTAQTSITTVITDSGKKSGVDWSYRITASVPVSDIDINVDYDVVNQKYSITVKMPHKVVGDIKLSKKIGCGVKIRDTIEISDGKIDPFDLTLSVEFVLGRNGREVILNPNTDADLYYKLKPKGIFAFLVTFLGKIIDKKVVEERIVAISNSQIISFIRAFIIPTIPQRKIRIGSTMLDESLFIALGEGNINNDRDDQQ